MEMRANLKVAMTSMLYQRKQCLEAHITGDHLDEENTSEEQDNDVIEKPEASAGIEDNCERSSCISVLGDTCTANPCIRKSRMAGRERRGRDKEIRKPNAYTNCSV